MNDFLTQPPRAFARAYGCPGGMTGRQPNGVQNDLNPPPSQHDIMPEIPTGQVEVTPELKHYVSRRPVLKKLNMPSQIKSSASDQFMCSGSQGLSGT